MAIPVGEYESLAQQVLEVYNEAELTMKLAEVSTYDMEGRYGKADQV